MIKTYGCARAVYGLCELEMREVQEQWTSVSICKGPNNRPYNPSQPVGESGQGDQVILILLTTGTTDRREASRHL